MSMPTLFDFAELEATIEAEQDRGYSGRAPLAFTAEYFTPEELLAAHAESTRLRGPWPWSRPDHTWKLGITTGYVDARTPGHSLVLLDADLRCDCRITHGGTVAGFEEAGGCRCPGQLLDQANCSDCRWHALGEENAVVEAWHDHAWPGWRDLPVLSLEHGQSLQTEKGWTKRALALIEELYPAEWQTEGAPVLTQRQRWGTRHVAGRSPWGGFDLSSTAVGGEVKVW